MSAAFAAQIARVSHAVVLSWGWRRAAIAFIAGAVSVLALAPVNAWPVLFLTFPVAVWLIEGASAGRLGGVIGAAIAGWFFGLRLLHRRPLLDRPRVPRRCQDLRVAAAVRGARPSGVPRILYGALLSGLRARCGRAARLRIIALALAHRVGRMAARTVLGLSLERVRLRAHHPARARSGRVTGRSVGPDVLCGLVVREPRGARRRSPRHAAAVARGSRSRSRVLGAFAVYGALRLSRTRAQLVAGVKLRLHAAESAAGREVQLCGGLPT